MPKSEKKALTHPSTLKSLCPATTAIWGPFGALSVTGGNWFTVTSTAGVRYPYWEGTIDLSAFVLKDLTWVTTDKDIQEPSNFTATLATASTFEVIEFVSNVPLDLSRLTRVVDDWELESAVPGMMGSTLNFENIINGRWRQFSTDTTLAAGSVIELKSSAFGSCEPSASEKLYSYVILKADRILDPDDTIFIPGRRFLLGGAAIEEDELAYIMRLRRSYILQQEA